MKYFILGGAGFIGSNLLARLFEEEKDFEAIVFDNLSSGKMEYISDFINTKNCRFINDDIKNLESLINSMKGVDIVYHFASNPDISKAVKQPDIDFWEGTYLTNNILEAMRTNGVKKLLYASGSGVYGEVGMNKVKEDYSPMLPISTYGASKLGCEALICSYSYMFGIDAVAFRFANVVGPNQTHGVAYDFIRKLKQTSSQLEILGDGTQDKSYIYVSDVIDAMRLVEKKYLNDFNYFNVATEDSITVKQIADIVVNLMGLKDVKYIYSGGSRGWKGDVPKIYLDSTKIRKLGWKNKFNSHEAIMRSVREMLEKSA